MSNYKIKKPLRLIELFAGIGSQHMALRDLGVDYEVHCVVDFDKYAVASYNAIFGTDFVPLDITEINGSDLNIVDTDKFDYLMTYSFPCTDLSIAGKGKGMSKGDGTRSGLLWEVERLLNEVDELPQILLMENVPQVHGKKNIGDFEKWISFLESKGYSNFWQDLNAKNYGVAQSRNRCFMISILGDYDYEFPKSISLDKCIIDYLEDFVDEKYYIKSEKAVNLIDELMLKEKTEFENDNEIGEIDLSYSRLAYSRDLCACITARYNAGINLPQNQRSGIFEIVVVGQMDNKADHTFESANRVYSPNGICPTLPTSCGGGHTPKILKVKSDKQSDVEMNKTPQKIGDFRYRINGVEYLGRIRKLTPKECWRLMGFTDEDFEKAACVNSDTQLYKQAGNSIVKSVLENLISQLYK